MGKKIYKARLTDGRVVVLEKDCGCLDEIHEGPHWLHMDRFDRERNREYLARATAVPTTPAEDAASRLAFQAHVQGEQVRLANKLRSLTSRGIAELLPVEEEP